MNTLSRIALLISFSILSYISIAQDGGYQRAYFGDERFIIVNTASAVIPGGGHYLVNVAVPEDPNDQRSLIHVSKHNIKGNLTWAKEYEIEDKIFFIDVRTIVAELMGDNSLFISCISLSQNTLDDEKLMLRIDGNGDLLWSNIVRDQIDAPHPFLSFPGITNDAENNINVFSTQISFDTTAIHANKFDVNNTKLSSQTYFVTDTLDNLLLGILTDATSSSIDSSNAMLFVPNLNGTSTSIAKVDNNGLPVYAKNYSFRPDSLNAANFQLFSFAATQDTGYVAVGQITDLASMLSHTIIIKTDTIGNVMWSKQINGSASGFTDFANDIIVTSQNEILITGKYVSFTMAGASTGDFGIFLDQQGNVVRQYDYGSENSLFILGTNLAFRWGQLSNMDSGEIFYSTTGIDPGTADVGPYTILMDSQGGATCHDTLDLDLISDFGIISDTLYMGVTDFALTDTLDVIQEDYNDYTTPVLNLMDVNLCPQDPIEVNIDAFVQGATAYIWSTMDTTRTIIATEEGEYSVTVTMGDKICYSLCDTMNIVVLDFPEAQINVDNSRACEDDIIVLTGALTAGAGADTYLWADGQTTSSIEITQPGTYAVTIIDNCENAADATIEISADQFIVGMTIDINEDLSLLCDQDLVILTATSNPAGVDYLWSNGETTQSIQVAASGSYSVTIDNICNETGMADFDIQPSVFMPVVDFSITEIVNGICAEKTSTLSINSTNTIVSYNWSNGSTDPSITVDMNAGVGNYSVTVTDNCDDTGEMTFNIADDFFDIPTLDLSITEGGFSCENGILLQVQNNTDNNGITQYDWSNGAMTDTLSVTSPGEYSITVTDVCGTSATQSISVELPEDEIIKFPNIFFPLSSNQVNKTFGPYIECPDLFSGQDYKLEIFNRWGDKLFESDQAEMRWNGRNNNAGNIVQKDVYMFVYSFLDTGGNEVKGGGSVTLSQ